MPSKCFKLQFPQPLRPAKPGQLVKGLELNALKYLFFTSFACYFFGRLHVGYFLGLVSILLGAMTYWVLGTETEEGLNWQLEKQEGAKTLYDTRGETVEWMNYFVQKIWRSIDPNVFVSVEDILEDTLQSIAPAVIKAVKVTDLDIGVHAPRIRKIRIFPPMPGQPEEAMFGEASFDFQANSSGNSRNVTSAPPGIAIRFKTGLKAPIDIKAELTKLQGSLRFKILTSPDMPFVSKVTISFVSVPNIDTGVMPMSKHMNVMKVPMMKTLVNEAVKLGFADLVDPKSMTLDIKELMGAAAQDTSSIGVVKVEVRQAKRTSTINLQDMEDAYATISLSTQEGKNAPSTRVLTNDEDPRWNENLYILVHQEEIVNEATVDIKVWDADKVKTDDAWGCASVPVKDIVCGKVDKLGNVTDWCKEERVVFDGWAPMDGKASLEESEVKLDFRMTYHPKYIAPPLPGLMTALNKNKKSKRQEELEQEECNPMHKSGILSVMVTEAADLEIGDPEMITADEFKHPYSPNQIVNPYAVNYLNDNKVYETRAKLRNPAPHWNAECEHLVKDYDSAFVRVSVKTSMDLERDPVLGTRLFFLKDVFGDQQGKFKEAERWVALANGIGFGKVLLNLKYKPVKLTLPRELRGSDVGTMIIDRVNFKLKHPFSSRNVRSTKATLALNIDPTILKRLKSRDLSTSTQTNSSEDVIVWQKSRPMYFPLTMRYRTALYVHVNQGSLSTTKAVGRLWLKKVCDGSWQEATIGLYEPVSGSECNKNEDDWSPDDGEFGQVVVRFKIVPGLSPVHTHLRSFQLDMLGADPFQDDTLKSKVEQWVKEAEDQEEAAQRRRESAITEASEVYGQEEEMADKEFLEDLQTYTRSHKIPRLFVFRKIARGTDIVRHRVETMRDGFNSENRASRAVTKE
ncbi:hypothetical protein BDB00DRAFT_755787 [Zychaea mexicana]|uniref:uncharacterized protein n=1 Tax=Zychaea mexicana TaxID=64656 RepID=UPI0022FE618A|nr:uncharacterized protein BDB00DRAFT_755787 [Zychaea mexicana]KAI9497976.1 hypothetical protein BDB00DRAFT_755787 [Zychaea mexicana]